MVIEKLIRLPVVLETREMIDSMMNGYGARNAITHLATYALNFNKKGLARTGDRFLIAMGTMQSIDRCTSFREDGVVV